MAAITPRDVQGGCVLSRHGPHVAEPDAQFLKSQRAIFTVALGRGAGLRQRILKGAPLRGYDILTFEFFVIIYFTQ